MQQHRHESINGVETDVVLQTFSDRTLILVTQLGRVGSLIQASIPPTTELPPPPLVSGQWPPPPPAIQLTNLLGSAPSEHARTLQSLYAAQIATLAWVAGASAHQPNRKSVVVGLALKKLEGELGEDEKNMFHGVMRVVDDMLKLKLKE